MNKKNTLFIIGIIFVLFFAILLQSPHIIRNPYNNTNICDQAATTTNCDKISLPSQPFGPQPVVYENENSGSSFLQSQGTDNWNIFKNIKYHYLIMYPSSVVIGTNNDYATKLNEEKSIYFFIPGKTILSGIDVEIIEPWEEKYYETRTLDSEKKFFKENKKIISLDLKSYAEYIRNQQVNEKNPYENQKIIGELREISFAGTKAYRFIMTKGFKSLSIEYALPSGVFTYLITENPVGQKMIIHYLSGNEISEKMIQSFQFFK